MELYGSLGRWTSYAGPRDEDGVGIMRGLPQQLTVRPCVCMIAFGPGSAEMGSELDIKGAAVLLLIEDR